MKHNLIVMALLGAILMLPGCTSSTKQTSEASAPEETTTSAEAEKQAVSTLLDEVNNAAAKANYQAYFDCYTDSAVFMGTDATERWGKPAFIAYAKPMFDKGKAWNFTSLGRHIYLSADHKTAWFDELLDTKAMKICRGSGVLVKQKGAWKVDQYVLSLTLPNDLLNQVVKMKAPAEDKLIEGK